jgi:hypothetical protein
MFIYFFLEFHFSVHNLIIQNAFFLIHLPFFLLSALFSAVEHGHLEKARTILESTDVDVNR